MVKVIITLALSSLLLACAPTRFAQPLEEGQRVVQFNTGGPLIGFAGTTIPVPFTTLTGGYGFRGDVTGFGSVYPTAMLFGVMQVEAGVVKSFSESEGFWPGISIAPSAVAMMDVWEGNFKFMPQFDVNAFWRYGDFNNVLYAGASNWFDFTTEGAHGEWQEHNWVYALHVGHSFVRSRWSYNLEVKFLAPEVSNRDVVVDYRGIGGYGAIGVYLGISRTF